MSAAATIRPVNGKLSITDGPFAETNEQLGGFILIELRPTEDISTVVHPTQSNKQ